MKRYKGTVRIGLVGCVVPFEFEIDDDATDKEIEDAARDAMLECVEWNYDEV